MSVYLIRHTTVANTSGVCYGNTEVSLTADFPTKAAEVCRALPPPPWRVFSSPFERCAKLACLLDPAFVTDHRLRELHFGDWELKRWDDLPRTQVDAWSRDFVNCSPPGGETFAALAERAEACMHEIQQLFPNDKILCVTHAGVIRALLARAWNLPLKNAFQIQVDFGGIYPLANRPVMLEKTLRA